MVVDRLSAQDLTMLWPDELGLMQDLGIVAVLDSDDIPVDVVRAQLASRLHLTPRLRQVVLVPSWGLGRPLWVDARQLDLSDHVRVRPIPAPGDETQLLSVIEELRSHRLDPARPLWQLWLLPGLPGGRTGMYLRVHHVVADGTAAVRLLTALFDPTRDAPPQLAQPWTPQPPPTKRDLFADRLDRGRAALRTMVAATDHPGEALRRARTAATAMRTAVKPSAPPSSLNQPIGRDRRLAVIRGDLAAVKDTARSSDATVNDVLLAAVTAGLRALLRDRGEPVDQLTLQAVVPIALPHPDQHHQEGNLLGQMIIPLPVGVADPHRRLQLITGQTAAHKQDASPRLLPVLRSHAMQRAALSVLAHQRAYNIYIANVHGPQTPLHLAGAQLLEVFPVVALLGNLTLSVGALSYNGQLNITAVGDRNTCPDLDRFATAMKAELNPLSPRTARA